MVVKKAKEKLVTQNKRIELKIQQEQQKLSRLELRYRTLEQVHAKTNTDCDLFKLKCQQVSQLLHLMLTRNERQMEGIVCGDRVSCVMTPLLHILSTMEDRRECEKIKVFTQQTVDDRFPKL